MFVLGNFVIAVAQITNILLTALYWLILVRALISWVNPDPFNPIVQLLHQATEPILEPIRRFLPSSGIDFSPLVAFLVIFFARSFIVGTLLDIGYRLQ
ncbi:MAG: YggT family protein [Candidatus Omnitrophica bacterium]|nr:YggT family protein [Candidatus Omnitrophota bacterium]